MKHDDETDRPTNPDDDGYEAERDRLARQLEEAESTLAAIRTGEVDAVVVDGPRGQRVYSLESSDHPYRVFIERMEEGAVTIAEDGSIAYANAFFARLVGVPLDRVMGAAFAAFVHDDDVDAYRALLLDGLRGPARAALRLVSSEGATIRTSVAVGPLPTRQPRTCAVVVTDLTTQERFERVDAARATAEAANLAKDQFLAMLGHELRTPLNAIVGWAQLLREKSDDKAIVSQGVETIMRNAYAQSKLIEDLLDVSRISTGKLRLERTTLDFNDVVKSALESIAPAADAKSIRVAYAAPNGATPLEGDASRLEQVVWNVLSNAVKFTATGGSIKIEVVVRPAAIELSIADDGQGIDPEFLPFVFESFRQANARSTTRNYGGLGLGLAITREIVELHGGTVRARSPGLGKGATFVIALPRGGAHAPVADATPFPWPRGADLSGLRFLVVDDDLDALEFMRRLLSSHGAKVAVAASADEAQDLVDTFDPHVLLSDVAMPQRDGYDLIRALRANGKSARKLPAIALTAFAGAEQRRLLLAAGFQHHIPKPLDFTQMVAALERLATPDAGERRGIGA